MKDMWHQLLLARTGQVLASRLAVASTRRARMVGLLDHRTLQDGEALFLPNCRSIHTWGMRFPIDAIFVDAAWRVVALKPGLGPWRVVPPIWSAWGTIELAQGTIGRTGLRIGDPLHLEKS